MALSYRDVLGEWERAKAFGEDRTLSDYAAGQNKLYKTDAYSEGLRDGPWTRGSTYLDIGLENTLGKPLGAIGGAVGSVFGHEQAGQEFGQKLPRMAADMSALFLAPEATIPASLATGAAIGGHTFADTGSAKAATIAGVAGAALPAASKVAGGVAARLAGAPKISGELMADAFGGKAGQAFSETLPQTFGQKAAQFGGSQVAQAGINMASNYGVQKTLAPDTPYNPLTDEHFWLQQIPFTVFDAIHTARAPIVPEGVARALVQKPQMAPTKAPELVPVEHSAEDQVRMEAALQNLISTAQKKEATSEELSAMTGMAANTVLNPKETKEIQKGVQAQQPSVDKSMQVVGRADGPNKLGNYRVLIDSHTNVENYGEMHGGTFFVNGVQPTEGPEPHQHTFNLTDPNKQMVRAGSALNPDFKLPKMTDPTQSELPERPESVPPTAIGVPILHPATQALGFNPEASLYDVGTPVGDAFSSVLQKPDVETLQKMEVTPPREVPSPMNDLEKSGNPVLSFISGGVKVDGNGIVRRLGSTDVAKDGWMNTNRFVKASGLPQAIIDAMPKEVFKGGSVDTTAAVKALGEMTTTRRLDINEGSTSAYDQREAQIQHELDTVWPNWRQVGRLEDATGPTLQAEELRQKYIQLSEEVANDTKITSTPESATARYSSVNPHPMSYLRGETTYQNGLQKCLWAGDFSVNFAGEEKFKSQHYPSEAGKNQGAFMRGALHEYLPGAKLPNGTVATKSQKVLELWEVQSDWQSDVAKWQARKTKDEKQGFLTDLETERNLRDREHPLLSIWEPLALRAAVIEARKMGADFIALSDAQSAMMTEGHDKAAPQRYEVDRTTGLPITPEISQAKGMVAAYDERLPQTLAKLTGDAGQPGVMSEEHQNARTAEARLGTRPDVDQPPGSPVFRDAQGNPKVTNTAHVFSLTKTRDVEEALKPIIADYEAASVASDVAKKNSTVVISDATQIPELVGAEPNVAINAASASGASSPQAVGDVILSTQSDALDVAERKMAVNKEQARVITGQKQKEMQAKGQLLLTAHRVRAEQNPESDSARIAAKVLQIQKDPNIRDPDAFEKQIYTVIAKNSDAPVEKTLGQLGKAAYRATQKGSVGIDFLKDAPSGKNKEAEVDKFLQNHPELVGQGYKKQPKKVTNERTGETYYSYSVGKRRYAPGDTTISLEQAYGEGEALSNTVPDQNAHIPGEDMDDRIEEDTDGLTESMPEKFAAPTTKELLPIVEEIVGNTEPFASHVKGDQANLGEVLDTHDAVVSARDALKTGKGLGDKDIQATIRSLFKYANGIRNFTFDSVAPHDEATVQKMGIRKGLKATLQWLVQHPDAGPAGVLINDMLKVVSPDNVVFAFPGEALHDARPGFQYYKGLDVTPTPENLSLRPRITTGSLPRGEADALPFAMNVAHEYAHHALTGLRERTDPQAIEFRQTLGQLRETLAKSPFLSAATKRTIRRATADGDYESYRVGKMSGDELRDKWAKVGGADAVRDLHIIYGLQHDEELLTSFFNSPELLTIAKHTKVPKTLIQSTLDLFSTAWNRLFGGKTTSDNALSQILLGFDNFLSSGRLRDGYNGKDLLRKLLIDGGTRYDSLASRLDSTERVFNTGSLQHSIRGFESEDTEGLLPTYENGGAINLNLRTSLLLGASGDVQKATENLLFHELSQHQSLWHRMAQDVAMAQELYTQIEKGTIPGVIPDGAKEMLRLSAAKVAAMQEGLKTQQTALARFNDLDQLTVEGWQRSLAQQLVGNNSPAPPPDVPARAEVAKEVAMDHLAGKSQIGWLARTFALQQHFKEMFPASKPVIGTTFEQQGRAIQRGIMLQGNFFYNPTKIGSDGIPGTIDTKIIETINKVRTNERRSTAASDLFRWLNKEGEMQKLDLKDAYVKEVLSNFDKDAQGWILQTLKSVENRHYVWTKVLLPEVLNKLNSEYTASLILGRETAMLPQQARELSQQLYSGLAQALDPQQAQVGSEALRMLSTKMQPDTYISALQHAQALAKNTADSIKVMQDNPGYVTEQRWGKDFLVMAGPQGQSFKLAGDRDALSKVQKDQQARGYEVVSYLRAQERGKANYGMTDEMIQMLDKLDQTNVQFVSQAFANQPEVLAKILPRLQRAGDIRAELAAAAPLPKVSRAFSEGREHINMLDNSDQFYQRMNGWAKNRLTRAITNVDMMHPQIAGNSELTFHLQNRVIDPFLTPDNPTATKVTSAIFYSKLAFNLGEAMLEGTQNLTTGMTTLIGETGSVRDAFELWGKSVKAITQHFLTKKWANDEHSQVIELADQQGILPVSRFSDYVDPDVNAVIDSGAGKSVMNSLKFGARGFANFFRAYNDKIALISAFDLATERGMEFADAYKFAADVKSRGLFMGGKAQRPGYYGDIKTRSIPQIMSSLTTYSLGFWSQMAENWKKGFGKAPEGLTETQRVGAKKAFAYSLISQAALAGVLGLPAVGQGLALFSQATGVDAKGWLKANLANLFDEDQQSGGLLTSLALRGFGSAGLPFDPSNRASISIPFLPVDSYKGFDPGLLGGAAGQTASDFVKGMLGLMHGDTRAADQMLPSVLKRPLQLWQGEGDIRDARGALQYQLSPFERFMMATGITPSRVQAARDTAEGIKKANDNAVKEQQSQSDELAKLYREKGAAAAQQKIVELAQKDQRINAQNLAHSVANRVQAQTNVQDPRLNANPFADLSGFGTSTPPSNEHRLQQQRQILQSLGATPSYSPRADYQAAMLDAWMGQDTTLSKAGAMDYVGRKPTRRSYSDLNLATQAFQ